MMNESVTCFSQKNSNTYYEGKTQNEEKGVCVNEKVSKLEVFMWEQEKVNAIGIRKEVKEGVAEEAD